MSRTQQHAQTICVIHKPIFSRFLSFWLIILIFASFAYKPSKLRAYDDIENPLGIPLIFNHENSIYSYRYNKKTREVLISKYNADTRETSVEGNFVFPEDIFAVTWNAAFVDNNLYITGYNSISGDSYSYLINTKGEIVLKKKYIPYKYDIYLSFKNGIKILSYFNVSDNLKYNKHDISIEYKINDKTIWKYSYAASDIHNFEDEIWVIDYASKRSYHLDIETGKTIETYEGKVEKIHKHNQTRIVFVTNPDNKTGYLHYKNPKLNISKKIYPTSKDSRLVIDMKNDDLYFVDESNPEKNTIVLTKMTPYAQTKTYKLFIKQDGIPSEGKEAVIAYIYNGLASVIIDGSHYIMGMYRIETGELIQHNTFHVMQTIEMFDNYYIARDASNYYVFDYSNPPKLIWILEYPSWGSSEDEFKNKLYFFNEHFEYPESKFTIKCQVYDTKTKEVQEYEFYKYVVEIKEISKAYFQIIPTIHGLLHIATSNEIDKSIKLYKPFKDAPQFTLPIKEGYNYSFDRYSNNDDVVLLREYYLHEPEKIRKFDLSEGQFID